MNSLIKLSTVWNELSDKFKYCLDEFSNLIALSTVLNDFSDNIKWDKVFKNGPSKICGRQPLKNFTLVHSWILCLKYCLEWILW